MRTGVDLAVETRATDGLLVRDQYRLRGAATAMDAAAIACAPPAVSGRFFIARHGETVFNAASLHAG